MTTSNFLLMSAPFCEHVIDSLLSVRCGHSGKVPDLEVARSFDPLFAFGVAAGDCFDCDAMENLVVTHLEDLRGEDVAEPCVLVWDRLSKAPVEAPHEFHEEDPGSREKVSEGLCRIREDALVLRF